jgi:transposase
LVCQRVLQGGIFPPVSTGFVHTVFIQAADLLAPYVDRLRDLLRAVPVLHADETPARLAGRWAYVHVACTDD